MRTLKLYAGVILILLTVVLLAATFYGEQLMDADANHIILVISLFLIIAGIGLVVWGGKSADKIGGK